MLYWTSKIIINILAIIITNGLLFSGYNSNFSVDKLNIINYVTTNELLLVDELILKSDINDDIFIIGVIIGILVSWVLLDWYKEIKAAEAAKKAEEAQKETPKTPEIQKETPKTPEAQKETSKTPEVPEVPKKIQPN